MLTLECGVSCQGVRCALSVKPRRPWPTRLRECGDPCVMFRTRIRLCAITRPSDTPHHPSVQLLKTDHHRLLLANHRTFSASHTSHRRNDPKGGSLLGLVFRPTSGKEDTVTRTKARRMMSDGRGAGGIILMWKRWGGYSSGLSGLWCTG
jgi:hypothetical protein